MPTTRSHAYSSRVLVDDYSGGDKTSPTGGTGRPRDSDGGSPDQNSTKNNGGDRGGGNNNDNNNNDNNGRRNNNNNGDNNDNGRNNNNDNNNRRGNNDNNNDNNNGNNRGNNKGNNNDNNGNNNDNNRNRNNDDNNRDGDTNNNKRSSDSRNDDNDRSNSRAEGTVGSHKVGTTQPASAIGARPSPPSSSHDLTPIIAGIVVGVGVLILLLISVICICTKKKKKRRNDQPPMQYYNEQQQYQNGPPGQWSSGFGPGGNQNMNMNNHSGGTGVSSGNWGPAMPPPPPPGQMMSSDMSGGYYSSGGMGPAAPPPHPGMSLGFNKSTFSYEELAAATANFAQGNMIGQGGFGYVHKGVLPNGKEIAVKSLKSGSGQGDREFQAEVDIISRVHHRHLVSLVGYCVAGGQRMLVYEFIANNTLEYHLHGQGRPVMPFATRMKIALGSAKGLAYLHEDCHPRIIHRDIKTANILIDMSFEAKVADFGLAKLNDTTQTHVSTRVMGTFGYLAPEYAASGKLTEKSDVFSFGVMLLELVTGRRPIDASDDEDTLVDWSRPLLPKAIEEGILEGLVDAKLEGNYDHQEMVRLIACAGASVRHSGKRRPKMDQIVRLLEGDASLEDLNNEGTKRTTAPGANEYDTVCYNNDMQQFRKMVLQDSGEYSNSDFEKKMIQTN